jgi:hypothetical protein
MLQIIVCEDHTDTLASEPPLHTYCGTCMVIRFVAPSFFQSCRATNQIRKHANTLVVLAFSLLRTITVADEITAILGAMETTYIPIYHAVTVRCRAPRVAQSSSVVVGPSKM